MRATALGEGARKYNTQLVIDPPQPCVIELFDNSENLPAWRVGLISFEPMSGVPGEPGARSRLIFDLGQREIEMIETVRRRALAEELAGTYEAPGVWNEITNLSPVEGQGRTRWVVVSEYRFAGAKRILSVFMRGSLRAQTRKMMAVFKACAESQAEQQQLEP